MRSAFASFTLAALLSCSAARAAPPLVRGLEPRHVGRAGNGVHLPIYRQAAPVVRRRRRKRGQTGAIGLGDVVDVTYNVLLTVGGVTTPLVLDTGSSDLWVLSDACRACGTEVPLYLQGTFQPAGLDARLLYGDSQTATHAFGLIGKDTVDLAGLRLPNQYFAAINDTNTSVVETGSAGIFGLGFPVNSVIWKALLATEQTPPNKTTRRLHDTNTDSYARSDFPNLTHLYDSISNRRGELPAIPNFAKEPRRSARQVSSPVHAIFDSYSQLGPLLGRLVYTAGLSAPMFTLTLQRDTVDVGGNAGMLSIGELPSSVNNGSLTWVPVRRYAVSQGGLAPPPESPNEQYPITWELFIDDVYLDGKKLPRSSLSSPTIALSALIDTGNSLLRGPADVVQSIYAKLGARFPCSEAHTLAFQIGGTLFPVDPRDLVSQALPGTVATCLPNLVETDPPAEGKYLYSWSLGDPFLKSVLSAYYFGNLSFPSQDPPRIGLLSTVPADAEALLRAAVQGAAQTGGNFPAVSESAPSGRPKTTKTNSNGIPEAQATVMMPNNTIPNAARSRSPSTAMEWPLVLMAVLVSGVMVVWAWA